MDHISNVRNTCKRLKCTPYELLQKDYIYELEKTRKMDEIKIIAQECYEEQTDPETTEFECFFHYDDESLFTAGFTKGYGLAQKRISALENACQNFINKVEGGKARSVSSYKEMKEALGFK